VMHHIPGHENRIALCRQIRSLLKPNGSFFLSVWQIKNSPRLMKRIRPWSLLEMDENEVEKGDVLLDWRAHHPDDAHEPALRYVHLLTEKELDDLARKCGFRVTISFYSDGKEGNLGLYQIWQHDF
jgi:tRNA (uracil-5-)-methyltransferase TRM9